MDPKIIGAFGVLSMCCICSSIVSGVMGGGSEEDPDPAAGAGADESGADESGADESGADESGDATTQLLPPQLLPPQLLPPQLLPPQLLQRHPVHYIYVYNLNAIGLMVK